MNDYAAEVICASVTQIEIFNVINWVSETRAVTYMKLRIKEEALESISGSYVRGSYSNKSSFLNSKIYLR